jgi:hypothetical protein
VSASHWTLFPDFGHESGHKEHPQNCLGGMLAMDQEKF